MTRIIKKTPPRLERIFSTYDPPLFFVTFCTLHRARLLATRAAHDAFRCYGEKAREHRAAVGRYVIMPDHVHLFVSLGGEHTLGRWIGQLRRAMAAALAEDQRKDLWQPGFFDHLIRNRESYSQKWEYVLQNPVRAGLVASPEEWPYQGEIDVIQHS